MMSTRRLDFLRDRHAAVDAQLIAAISHPHKDQVVIRKLKVSKLRMKDEIAGIELQRRASSPASINAPASRRPWKQRRSTDGLVAH